MSRNAFGRAGRIACGCLLAAVMLRCSAPSSASAQTTTFGPGFTAEPLLTVMKSRLLRDGEISEVLARTDSAREPKEHLLFVNGLSACCTRARDQAKAIAQQLQYTRGIRLVYNDLTLPVIDHLAVFVDKMLGNTGANAATCSVKPWMLRRSGDTKIDA